MWEPNTITLFWNGGDEFFLPRKPINYTAKQANLIYFSFLLSEMNALFPRHLLVTAKKLSNFSRPQMNACLNFLLNINWLRNAEVDNNKKVSNPFPFASNVKSQTSTLYITLGLCGITAKQWKRLNCTTGALNGVK